MRPHKLIMKAFGPFAKETVVDFDAMGNTIYLICGDTGSGKTTIFDAMIYALYGTASGGARSKLGTEAFHSDYAKDGNRREEMKVSLSFVNAEREFTVVRKMYWGKKGDASTVTKESTLSEKGNVIVHAKGAEYKDEVTAKVTEILGLDADQFRRIIMLAQGEFQKFLTAKSDERGTILGKLYDNRQHQDFQFRLKAAANLLNKKDYEAVEEAKAQLKVIELPDNVDEDDRAGISVDHPLLLSSIKRILDRIDSDLAGLSETIQQEEELQKSLEVQKTQGEACNSLIDDLSDKRTHLSDLDSKKEQMDSSRMLIKLAEAAEKVLPFENSMVQANKEWALILKKVQNLEEKRNQLEEQAASLQKQAETIDKTNAPQITDLKNKKSAIQSILHFYEDLANSIETYSKKKEDLGKAEENVRNAQEELNQKKQRQSELVEELKRLDSAGEMAVTIAQNRLKELCTRQTSLKGIKSSINSVQTLVEEEASLALNLQDAQNAEIAAETEHLRLNTAFVQGQAGLLAQDMREKLKADAEVICPVCGAKHTSADISSFAVLHESIPTKEMVDNAFTAWEQARRKAKEAEKEHIAKAKILTGEMKSLLAKTGELISVSQWDVLVSGTDLADAIKACDEQIAGAQAVYDQAVKDKIDKEDSLSEKEQIDEAVVTADDALSAAKETQNNAHKELAVAETNVANCNKQLKGYPENKDAAQSLIDSLNDQAEEFQKQIDEAKEAYSNCLTDQAENNGNLMGAYSEKDTREKAKNQATEAFTTQLKRWSFVNEEDYKTALSPEGDLLDQEGLAIWISAAKKTVDGYDQSRRDLEAEIKQLVESTKGKERVNVDSIQEQITNVSEKLKALRTQETGLSTKAQTDHKVYKELLSIQERRSKYQNIFAKLSPLAETANGRYAFSRYVLTGFFHRIVEQANIHLETMTDGEFCLVPKETGDGRSTVGLDLRVLNTITNIERDTATLSGGQLFEASLALALGLSDIVQMESASSIQIDSMFIDEGFGSLDGGRLDKAIEVLQHLSAGKRQIGIISHVARLDECLPKKIHVIAGDKGSTVRLETDV